MPHVSIRVGGAIALLIAAGCIGAQSMAQQTPPATTKPIPGYTYGDLKLARSPVSLAELESLKKSMLLTDEDIKYLRMSKAILADQTDEILDVWYGFVASTPELVYFFGNKDSGKPEGEYLARVRVRFSQWILDTADANFDQRWLDYQHEIALRHHRSKKNKTDGAASVPQVNYRYIPALTIPITTTLKPFLASKGASAEDVEKMHAAWVKTVLLQSILWGQPYVRDGEF
jgi:Protoglobin